LVSVSKAEKASLLARIASPEVYKGAGLEFPYGNKFKFQVESRANGDAYLRVSSAQPVSDPFVSLLVELTWSSGKLLREYTFLLDPPGYVPEQLKQAEVQVVAPTAPAAPVVAAAPAVAPVAEPSTLERQSQLESAEALKKQPETMRATAPGDEKALAKQAVAEPEQKTVSPKRAAAQPAKKDFNAAVSPCNAATH